MSDLRPFKNFDDFLASESASHDVISLKRSYIDAAGDLVAGLVLSQIIYWHLPGKGDKPKLRVKREDSLVLAKNHSDWWEEIRVSPKQAARALKKLAKDGLITVRNGMFDGKRTPLIQPCETQFLKRLSEVVRSYKAIPDQSVATKGRYRSYHSVETDRDQRSLPSSSPTSSPTSSLPPFNPPEGGNAASLRSAAVRASLRSGRKSSEEEPKRERIAQRKRELGEESFMGLEENLL